ncbi:glycosyl transferase family 2 [Tamlana nanhaiensis]|uniref:Glycosyl transferase family 2 n=2 Tax=Neotamlana nanhaiensis TaxID=1382798 RepID=A0A0D7VXL3_9FLAO|nr:glycosyl transferase family 2 [Tamlana nanhaiensis]
MPTISIIIPVLNEAEHISKLLAYLLNNAKSPENLEIFVVDGGSTDATVSIIKDLNLNQVNLLHAAKGRAKQMNFGAKHANGSILYFLHADSYPPKHFDYFILNEVENGNEAGCFKMQFNSDHWWLKLASWFTQFNLMACRGGDQSQFITKSLFNAIGGYNEAFIIYEDYILIKTLYRINTFVVIQKNLKTSARLYETQGVFKLQRIFLTIYLKRWLGASPETLHRYYKKALA